MSVVPLLVLCSLCLVGGSLVLFAWSVLQRDHEHTDRLSLLPLEDDDPETRPTKQSPARGVAAQSAGPAGAAKPDQKRSSSCS